MAYSITIKNEDEFTNLVKSKDKKLSMEVVQTILDNLDTKKRFINILEIHLENSGVTLDITADREHFTDTLLKNLDTLIFHEEYEMCSKIKEAIKYLSTSTEN